MAPPLSPYLRNIPPSTSGTGYPEISGTSSSGLTSTSVSTGGHQGTMDGLRRLWNWWIYEPESIDSGLKSLLSSSEEPNSVFHSSLEPGSGSAIRTIWLKRGKVPVEYVELVQKFSPGYIVLSYCVAVVGSLCTLELLLRR